MEEINIVYDLGKITDWLSAIGTIGAVIVALHLSRKDRKPQAKVTASFGYGVTNDGNVSTDPLYISIEIVNQGIVPIYLSEATIQLNKWTAERMVFLNGDHKVNTLLKPGEFHEHKLDYNDFKNYYLGKGINKINTNAFYLDAGGKKYKTKIKFYF
ncbi:hypothetical protein MST22_17865 [Virgibacillus halodenitrificans]|uniref:hypothetical protein n=1 Tax=Virgibacillus halodenitrificans TaxID=1482 RepID=UPI001FB1F45E|nr:hypothetical protein [Virgibacillus halodenitrificans]MCJ0933022.1 hypothetical protein [Virgibacillus halodenitrificans]